MLAITSSVAVTWVFLEYILVMIYKSQEYFKKWQYVKPSPFHKVFTLNRSGKKGMWTHNSLYNFTAHTVSYFPSPIALATFK